MEGAAARRRHSNLVGASALRGAARRRPHFFRKKKPERSFSLEMIQRSWRRDYSVMTRRRQGSRRSGE